MGNKVSIEGVFEMMGLGSEEDRQKYKFDALYVHNNNWDLKIRVGANSLPSDGKVYEEDAQLEHNFK